MTVNEIARACGFELPSYFIKIFRRNAGMTPGEFRKTFGRLYINNL
jgi:AraC-like DNA-binding protein